MDFNRRISTPLGVIGVFRVSTAPCGSWLASDSGGSVDNDVDCADVIAGKPAPTGFVGVAQTLSSRNSRSQELITRLKFSCSARLTAT
ncbi:hypothetical protein FCH79_02510 [Pseudomonas koreensis]|nr:hypothetical protein [Pseudomonas koreensis]